jgi:hypothetical protein
LFSQKIDLNIFFRTGILSAIIVYDFLFFGVIYYIIYYRNKKLVFKFVDNISNFSDEIIIADSLQESTQPAETKNINSKTKVLKKSYMVFVGTFILLIPFYFIKNLIDMSSREESRYIINVILGISITVGVAYFIYNTFKVKK